jgi:hypothetical protein
MQEKGEKMSREIEYKAWNGEIFSEPFHPWELLADGCGGLTDKNGCSVWWDSDGFRGENWAQYTGLKDKNGKKIFEGDILLQKDFGQIERFWGIVRWQITGFVISYHVSKKRWTEITCCVDGDSSHWEVIGNIYENPELLEVKNEQF